MAITYTPGAFAGTYANAVDQILTHDGTTVSSEYAKIHDGHEHVWNDRENTGSQDVLNAVLTGDLKKIDTAVRDWQIRQNRILTLTSDIDGPIYKALRSAYQATAEHNYTAIAKAFDKAAQRLREHADAVTLDAHSDSILELDDPARQAWLEAPRTARLLDQLAGALALAAEVAGITYAAPGTNPAEALNGLTIDRTALTDWKTWAAIDDARQGNHRAGKWGQLAQNGLTIRATAYNDITPMGRPAEPAKRIIHTDMGAGIKGMQLVNAE